MKFYTLTGVSLIALCTLPSTALAQTNVVDPNNPILRDVVTVTSTHINETTSHVQNPDQHPVHGADTAQLLSRTPGGNRIGNGEMSGQVQYRGLFGDRINVRVNSQTFDSGGPNKMDPKLHYAPTPLIQSIEIDRGASPVRAGPGLAGGANAIFKSVGYSNTQTATPRYDITTQGRTINDSYAIGGILGTSTDNLRFNAIGHYEEGGNTETPVGTIRSSEYTRSIFGINTGFRTGSNEFGLELRRHNTDNAGNAPLPMDIRYIDTDFARATWTGDFQSVRFDASLNFADVAHAMNNFEQRPAPTPMRYRETIAYGTTRNFDTSATFDAWNGQMQIGLSADDIDHDVQITNPNNPNFHVDNLPDINLKRHGVFVEWTGDLGPISGELGVRVDQHKASAGSATVGTALPPMPGMLAMAFNNADRTKENTTVDALARLWFQSSDTLTWRANLGRKQRAPGYLERFAWLPTKASGGLADGNVYVGDLNIDPETMWLAELGFDYTTSSSYIRPTVFVRHVDDYIQGTPVDATIGVIDSPIEMIASMNGDSTPLRFSNVDARLYGFDLDAGMKLSDQWRIDGVASYVRGERDDIDDNLYRIAPPSLTVGLTYEASNWSTTLETRAVAEQTDVSLTNSEQETPGYVTLNLFGQINLSEGVNLSAGIENLLDHTYRDHLTGYNRNAASDIPLGERIPGAGRGAFVRLHINR